MRTFIQNIDNYLLHRYSDSTLITRQKARLLFIYYSIGLMILPVHFIYMYFIANVDFMQLVGSFPGFLVIFISNYFLIKGRYDVSANIGLCTLLLLMGYATFQNIEHAPMNVISMNMYIYIFTIVQAALFNRTVWLCGAAAASMAVDICSYYLSINRLNAAESTYYVTGFISSLISIIMTFVLSLLYKKIAQYAITRSESESETNKKQFCQIKDLLVSVSSTSDKLAEHSGLLTNNANTFFEGSQSQAATIEEISAASEEVMTGVEQVFQVAHEQQQGLVMLLRKMSELFSVTNEIGEQIVNVSRSSKEITDMAEKGNNALVQMQSGMKSVSESANAMKNIVSMINDIADKINLLSLNASIEAARAGQSGRGFAVVADEISRLGTMTQSSMADIDKLIQSSNNDINAGLKSVDITVTAISEIIKAINRIINEINTISNKSKTQQDINMTVNAESETLRIQSDQIEEMMNMQQISINEIVKSITSINEITQTYVDGSRKLHADAAMVGKLAEMLKRDVNIQ